jgi:hypothetical protein
MTSGAASALLQLLEDTALNAGQIIWAGNIQGLAIQAKTEACGAGAGIDVPEQQSGHLIVRMRLQS